MDFKDVIKQLADRAVKVKDNLKTEEATKNAIIMPFIQALGYDVFNPIEVVPEFICDVAGKKGEKIDYAVMKDGKPIIIVECKHWEQDINQHREQLIRYFNVSQAKFAILTNGYRYKFFTETEPNKMDDIPFLEFEISEIRDNQVVELQKFHKSYFNENEIINTAQELKYTNAIKKVFIDELANPSDDFVDFFARKVYSGRITEKITSQFKPLVKKSIEQNINETYTNRLKTALQTEKELEAKEQAENQTEEVHDDNRIVTTQEELDALYIVRAILRPYIEASRIGYRDTVNYFNIILDDNIRKRICIMYLNGSKWYIGVFDESKNEVKHQINNLTNIYDYSDVLINTVKGLLNKNVSETHNE